MPGHLKLKNIIIITSTLLLALGALSCAEAELSDVDSAMDPDAGHRDVGDPDAHRGDTDDPDAQNHSYRACVLGGDALWEPGFGEDCVATTLLDFGSVGVGQAQTRRVRLDNFGSAGLQVTQASIADPAFQIQASVAPQGQAPSDTLLPADLLPADLGAGEAMFFEVTLSGSGSDAGFGADVFKVTVKPSATEPAEDISIPISGDYSTCSGDSANCDGDSSTGCETDISASLQHCGGCNIACDLANATATCEAGVCQVEECADGTFDANGDPGDGCECEVTDANDIPNGADTNCDGIDGDAARAIFVANNGSDSGAGTRSAPLKTIGAAIEQAQSSSGRDHIYVAIGQYNEQVTLTDGISIFGGYDAADSWSRSASATSKIYYNGGGERIAVRGVDITAETTLAQLEIESADTSAASKSNYAIHCKNCGGLRIQNSIIKAGAAGDGSAGSDGIDGSSAFGRGSDGGIGGNGEGDGSNWGSGGTAGASGCGRTGGAGGRGGYVGDNPGQPGHTGRVGSTGGAGGEGDGSFWFPVGEDGQEGAHGATVSTNGQNGSGGAGGTVAQDLWQGNPGDEGSDGAHGNGGGGGGGGGGQKATTSNLDGAGNGGGGGGGGGCRGGKASGGSAGGSSFGLFLINSTGVTLTANEIISGKGGNGGKGGKGGQGSPGGSGKRGGNAATSEIGAGGDGGDGSAGSDGGHGGGGAGGNSYGIYRVSTDLAADVATTNEIQPGQPGQGGSSPGHSGAAGTAAAF